MSEFHAEEDLVALNDCHPCGLGAWIDLDLNRFCHRFVNRLFQEDDEGMPPQDSGFALRKKSPGFPRMNRVLRHSVSIHHENKIGHVRFLRFHG